MPRYVPAHYVLGAVSTASLLMVLAQSPEDAMAVLEFGLLGFACYGCDQGEERLAITVLLLAAALTIVDALLPFWTSSWQFRLFTVVLAHFGALLIRPRLVKPAVARTSTKNAPVATAADEASSPSKGKPTHGRTLSAWRERSTAGSVDSTYTPSTFYLNEDTGETTWEKPEDFVTDEERERELDRARMVFDWTQTLPVCLAEVDGLAHDKRLEQLALMIKHVDGDWWTVATRDDGAFLLTLVGEQTSTPLARASLGLFLVRLLARGDPVRALMLISDTLFISGNTGTRFMDTMALGLHEGGDADEKAAWAQVSKLTFQARFDCQLEWDNDAYVRDLFALAVADVGDASMNAVKALIGLNWFLTGGVASELAVCSSLLPELDVAPLVGLVRLGELGIVGSAQTSAARSVTWPNSVLRVASEDAAAAARLTTGLLLLLNSLGGASTRSPPVPLKAQKGRPSLRKQVSDRRISTFEYVSKDAALLTQAMRMLLTVLFHDEAEPCLLFSSDLAICLDLLLLELASTGATEFSRFAVLQALLGVLVRAEWIVSTALVEFPKRAETVQVLASIAHSPNANEPQVYRVLAGEILALLGAL